MSFLDESRYSSLANKENYKDLLLAMYYLMNTNAQTARNKFGEVALMTGKIRMASDSQFEEHPSEVFSATKTIVENTRLAKYINVYLSTPESLLNSRKLNRIKTLLIYITNSGLLVNNYHKFIIPEYIYTDASKKKSLKSVVEDIYNEVIMNNQRLYSEFYAKYPLLKDDEEMSREDYIIKQDFHSSMRSKAYAAGLPYDIEAMLKEINAMRKRIERNLTPELDMLYPLFELPSTTYDSNKNKVLQELFLLIPTKDSNRFLMQLN